MGGQVGDELLGVAVGLEAAPVLVAVPVAETAYLGADDGEVVGFGEVHPGPLLHRLPGT